MGLIKKALFPVLILLFVLFLKTQSVYAAEIVKCSISPEQPKKGQTITVNIELKSSDKLKGVLHLDKLVLNDRIHKFDLNVDREKPEVIHSFKNLSVYGEPPIINEPGIYEVNFRPDGEDMACHRDKDNNEDAGIVFIINDNRSLTLVEPSKTITENFKTLDQIIISGLEPNQEYQLYRQYWPTHRDSANQFITDADGNNPNVRDQNVWQTKNSRQLEIFGTCENGEAGRNDCGAYFQTGYYPIDVFKNPAGPSTYIGTLMFKVDVDLASGENPCKQNKDEGETSISCTTALGRIPTNPTEFTGIILSIAIGIAGGIALILMVLGAITILTSSGDQNRLNSGRDRIVAAIAGLLFLIFSILILRFLGIVLKLPFL